MEDTSAYSQDLQEQGIGGINELAMRKGKPANCYRLDCDQCDWSYPSCARKAVIWWKVFVEKEEFFNEIWEEMK